MKIGVAYVTCVVIQFGIGLESLGHITWKLMKRNDEFT